MAEKAHTPGPWFLEGNWCPNSHRPLGGWVSHFAPSGVPVFGLEPSVGTLEEIAANARLIAAAPDLLDAAKEGRTDLMIAADNARDAAKTDPRWEGVGEKLMARVAMMDAAIARATGEKQ